MTGGPVAYVAAASFAAGAERMTATWLRATPALGFPVAFVFAQTPGPAADLYRRTGVVVHTGTGARARNLPALAADVLHLRRLLRRHRPLLIHAAGARASLFAGLAAAGLGIPVVAVLHDPPGRDPLTRASFRLPMTRLANSAVTAAAAEAAYGVRPRVVRLGAEVADYAFDAAARERFRQAHGIPDDALVVAYIGRLQRWKGVHNVVAAAGAARVPGLRVLIVGSPDTADDRAYEGELRAQAAPLGDRVTWVPRVADAVPAYAAADIVVHSPDRPEPFGRVIVEAMAAGRYVIAAAEGGPAEMITPGAGALVPPRDPAAIARALESFTPALARTAAKSGPLAAQHWSAEASARSLTEEYLKAFSPLAGEVARSAGGGDGPNRATQRSAAQRSTTPPPLRIALIHTTLPNPERPKEGGVTHHVHRLAQSLAANGHHVDVYSADPAPPGSIYRRLPLPAPAWATRGLLARTLALPLFLNRIDWRAYDAVHAHGDDAFLLAPNRVRSLHGSAAGERAAATGRRRRLGQLFLVPFERLSARTAAAAIVHSVASLQDHPRARLTGRYAAPPGFEPGPKSERPSILFVGELGGRKRGALLLEAFHDHVLPAVPGAELWMVAGAEIHAPGVVSIPNPTDAELAGLYRAAWLYCGPSTYEGFGLPYAEAMTSGTPVVATDNPGAREQLAEGGGVIVADGDLGPTLARLLADASERDRLAGEALAATAARSWPALVAAHERLYRSLATGGHGGRPVHVLVPSLNTRAATELCIRSLSRTAGHPLHLTAADSGSTDGTRQALKQLQARSLVDAVVEIPGRTHTEWLDWWRAEHPDGLLLYVDSDVRFRRRGWLAEMVEAAESAAMVAGELVPETAGYVEPVGHRTGRLAARPSTWLLLIDAQKLQDVPTSFAFAKEDPAPDVPEGMILYDVAAALQREVERRGLGFIAMPRSFQGAYVHYGGLSWIPLRGRRGLKKARDLAAVRLHLAWLRLVQR